MTTAHLFAFNATIAKELKERLAAVNDRGESLVFEAPLPYEPSPHQTAVFNWVANGRGSLVLEAVAGSGKTTTVLAALRHAKGLDARNTRASTFHSVGFSALAKKLGKPHDQFKVEDSKVKKLAREHLGELEFDLYGDFAAKLVGLAKGAGIGALTPNLPELWFEIVSHHDLYLEAEEAREDRAVEIARDLLLKSNEAAREHAWIDYDDMLYLPLLWRVRLWQNDWVFIDEAQDTNPVRRAIAKLALRPGGRLVAVGDSHQAIYGFTGASHDALDLIRREFNAASLSLPVSYRCPKAVAAKVHPLVPHFTVPEGARQGVVKRIGLDAALKIAEPADAVLCRQTAPLVGLAFQLIAKGRACRVLGKEIGTGLVNLVHRMKAKGIDGLLVKLGEYRDREVTKHLAKGEEAKAEAVSDRVACVRTVIENLSEPERTIPGLARKIEALFNDAGSALSLATVHKVKGKEYKRVFILSPELMPSKWARQEHQYKQELNLQYVAWTRTLDELYEIVDGCWDSEED